jgi:hypothetical protein
MCHLRVGESNCYDDSLHCCPQGFGGAYRGGSDVRTRVRQAESGDVFFDGMSL